MDDPRKEPTPETNNYQTAEPQGQLLTRRTRCWLEVLCLIAIMGLGLWLRVEDLGDWTKRPGSGLSQGEPYTITLDGYYYLNIARRLLDGTYQPVDSNRVVPDGHTPMAFPPLISVLIAGLAKVLAVSVNWVGALLAPVLGVMLAIPLYLLGRQLAGSGTGLIAALVGLIAPYYAYRTNIGWMDTDTMVVTFALLGAYLFLRFARSAGNQRYLYALLGAALYGIYLWWWDMAPSVVSFNMLLPFAMALIFFYRPSRREGRIFFGILGGILLVLLAWKGLDFPSQLIKQGLGKLSYVAKEVNGHFPNIGVTISEQKAPGLERIIFSGAGNHQIFWGGLLGLALLFWKRPKHSTLLLAPVVLSFLGAFYAGRFLIFLSPLCGLGFGYLLVVLWRRLKRWHPALTLVSALILAVSAVPNVLYNRANTFYPKPSPDVVALIKEAGSKTPDDAVIWSWWDISYPILFWADRGTIADGSAHGGERSVYNGLPMAADDFRLAANFMRFFVVRGEKGMKLLYRALGDDPDRGLKLAKRILAAGPEKARALIDKAALESTDNLRSTDDWLRFFYPREHRPIYLLLDKSLITTSYWWYWLGSWDVSRKEGIHPRVKSFRGLRTNSRGEIAGNGVRIDQKNGVLHVRGERIPLSRLSIYMDDNRQFKVKTRGYRQGRGFVLTYFQSTGVGVLQDKTLADSVFGKLYLSDQFPESYFKPVLLFPDIGQLWKVTPDTL
jgi:asparagine N-glycosylation enzyme membrane subunit Stt3